MIKTSPLPILISLAGCLACGGSNVKADDLGLIAGTWALDKTPCNVKPEEADNILKIDQDGKNDRYETSCQASAIVVRGSRIVMKNSCLSEGMRSREDAIVSLISTDRLAWKDGSGPPVAYHRCSTGTAAQGQKPSSGSSFETGSFMLSSHGYSATITSLSGADTTNATMTGRVTREDAKEECERNSPGGEGLKPKAMTKCVAATMKVEVGKTYTATADCKSRTIVASFGGRFKIVGADEYGSARILDSKGQELGGTTASGAPSIGSQFERVCPVTFERLKRKRA